MSKDEAWLLKEKYGGEKTEGFFADAQRLRTGEPLAYVIGHAPFLNCTIHLASKPLIPRPETEFWVEKAINEIKTRPQASPHILDLCAGSGCIGVGVAKAIPEAHITFAEIDDAHLPTIALNLKENNIDETLHTIVVSDLFKNVQGTFDFILSNPPYIDPALNRTEESVTAHEPHQALFGGPKGLVVIEKIIRDANNYLNVNGQLWLEHEPEQTKTIQEHAKTHGFACQTHNDQYGTPRYSILHVAQ